MPTSPDPVRCALDSCLLTDRSDLARLIAVGPDILPLLQRLGTGDVLRLGPGDAGRTVLTTNKGRIVQHLFVNSLGEEGVLLVGGTESGPEIVEHLRRYTFAEKTGLTDESANLFQLALIGPLAGDALTELGLPTPDAGGALAGRLGDTPIRVLGNDGSTASGYSVIGPTGRAPDTTAALLSAIESRGGCAGDPAALEAYRILRGIPLARHELTLDYNPLEAGLWDAVSFDKGCYVGQEVVARLKTYDKVSRVIVGLELGKPTTLPSPGAKIAIDGRRCGTLTSSIDLPGGDRSIGLGYLKRKLLLPELVVTVEGMDTEARVVDLPFAY